MILCEFINFILVLTGDINEETNQGELGLTGGSCAAVVHAVFQTLRLKAH